MPPRKPPLSRREREIMELVYRLGAPTAAEIAAALVDPPSYSAVRATIAVLESKGHLRHEARGGRYAYLPTVPQAVARRRALRDLVTTFFQGSPKQAVVALLGETDSLSAADLDEIRAMIASSEGELARRSSLAGGSGNPPRVPGNIASSEGELARRRSLAGGSGNPPRVPGNIASSEGELARRSSLAGGSGNPPRVPGNIASSEGELARR